MAKLSTYANNLFTTQATLDAALEYAATVANACETPSAVMTAVQVVLNTAISMHHAELAAANRPLIEMIDARVAAAVADLRSDLDDQITEKLDDIDLDSKIQDWMDNNFDAENALSGTSMRISFD
jgi:hypothetical protein